MSEVSQLTACVVDHGLFLPVAHRLAESFKRVLYFSPWEEGFSKIHKACVGDGYDNIERCDDIWKVKKDVDLFVFPDVGRSGEQLELEAQGYPVWGSRDGSKQELNRPLFLKTLKAVGLDVPKHHICDGWTALRDYLKDKEDCYVKISTYRGMQETTHWRNWRLDEDMLYAWAVKWGLSKEDVLFLVFDNIETDLEIGGDTYCVDGKWPSLMLSGTEWKDEGYFGSVTKRTEMPEQIQEVLDAFSLVLKKYRYRNEWSMELRVTDDAAYFIDPTCRGGLPSTGSQIELWENFPEIIWAGAQGELIEPVPAAMFSAECALTMKGERERWSITEVPEALKRWMKVTGCCQRNGLIGFPPDDGGDGHIGWLVAIGDTPEETIQTMKEHAAMLPDGVKANVECLANVIKEIDSAKDEGLELATQPMPEPATVIET